MTPEQYCLQKTRGAGSSFYYAFVFLPPEQRRAMMALYAFCREVDDIADQVSDRQVATGKLAFWQDELQRCFAGQPRHPVGKELNRAREHFSIDEELFREIIDGMLMDINRQPILKQADLSLYCYRVAGAVGLLSIEIFGYRNRQSRMFATHLGEALQLTNILRDIREDALVGRIYLSQEDRIRFNVRDQDFKEKTCSPTLKTLIHHYADRAEEKYRQALELLPTEDRTSLRPSLLMAAIYHAQLTRIRNNDYDVITCSAHISPLRKLWIAARMWRREKRAEASARPIRLTS